METILNVLQWKTGSTTRVLPTMEYYSRTKRNKILSTQQFGYISRELHRMKTSQSQKGHTFENM